METLAETPAKTNRLDQLKKLQKTNKYISFPMFRGTMSENGGVTWVAEMKMGTPAQKVNLMLDTGTLNTWVTGASCTTEACKAHDSFNPDHSRTFKMTEDTPQKESFGPWGDMYVQKGKDIIQLDSPTMEVPVERFEFMLAVDYSGEQFKELVADGGLAIPSIPDKEATALLNKLYKQGEIDQPFASFYYNKQLGFGECRMGALNTEYFDPNTYNILELVKPNGGKDLAYLWAVNMDSLTIGGSPVYPGVQTQLVLDTGSSFFKGASSVITPLIDAVTQNGTLATTLTSPDELKNYEDIIITLNGVEYTLKPEQYFVEIGNTLVLGIQILEGMPENMLLVGQVFLETVYSIFDFGDKDLNKRCVILANPIHQPLNAEGTWENQYGSTLVIDKITNEGTFTGTYSSDTGATGKYPVMGTADPKPGMSQTVSFSVTWKSLEGPYDPSWHYVSGITGVLSYVNGEEILQTTMLLQKNLSNSVPSYEATTVSSLTFKRKK